MRGRDWREGLRNAVPWIIFSISLVALVVSLLAFILEMGAV